MEGRNPPAFSLGWRPRRQWQGWLWRTVLCEGLRLLDEVGARRFTVKELALRVGVARSTIYKYFGMKAEVLALCMERYQLSGPDHKKVAGRIAYRIVLEGIAQSETQGGKGNKGPLIAELLATYVHEVAQSAERELWLLAAAEAVRSPKPPRTESWPLAPNPIRDGVRTCVATILEGGANPTTAAGSAASGGARAASTDETYATLLYAISALVWYEACLHGPRGDARSSANLRRRRPPAIPLSLRRIRGPEHPRGSADMCRRVIDWLLQGAGLATKQLPPLPRLNGNRMALSLRMGHPTGLVLDKLQDEARMFDMDDWEALLPEKAPMSPPFTLPPQVPAGTA